MSKNLTNSERLIREVRIIRRLLFCVLFISAGTILYFGQNVFLPVVLGILISLALSPPVAMLKKWYIPYPIGAILIIVSIGSLLYFGALTLSTPLSDLFEDIPRIGERLEEQFRPFQETVDQINKTGDDMGISPGGAPSDNSSEVTLGSPGIITSAASTFATTVTSVLIALVLALFILGSGNLYYEKIVFAIPNAHDKIRAMGIAREVQRQVSRYLFTITFVNISLGIVVAAALALYGAPNPVLWGSLAAILNFLPFLGAMIGAVLLLLTSFGYYDTLATAIIPPFIYYSATLIEGNFVTPYVVGRSMKLNIVVVFVSVVFWAWLWGLVGALMAVPILVVFSVLAENIGKWRLFHEMLSGRSEAGSIMPENTSGK